MSTLNVAVIFGSRSAEHDVSIITALNAVIRPLELSKRFNVVPIYVAKDGAWYSHDSLKEIATYRSNLETTLSKLKPISLECNGSFTIIQPGLKVKRQRIDVVFPATHGTFGEDGALMGLLEMANVPYVGCSMPASVLAMDKVLAKIMATSANIATPQMRYTSASSFAAAPDDFVQDVMDNLQFPLFVKPAHLGSSIAITRVENRQELLNAIELAARYDERILVEEAVANLIEVTVPIIGNDTPRAAQTEEPNQGTDFFDFETKYMKQGKGKSGSKTAGDQSAQGYSHIPARITEDLQTRCTETALAVYRALGCSGIARVDLLLDSKTETVYFNEVNPLPGSLYAHNWRASGVSNVQLVEKLIDLALESYAAKQSRTTVFSTNFLQQF